MRRTRHSRLVALNGALLGALALVTFTPSAPAQRGGAPRETHRARGEYTMVGGRVLGLAESAIYIIDSANSELLAVRWDRSRQNLAPLGFRDLTLDAKAPAGVFVPSTAIRDRDGSKVVFIAYNGKAVAREVHIASQRADGALVDGLVGGENVITAAPANLKDGDKIKVKGQS